MNNGPAQNDLDTRDKITLSIEESKMLQHLIKSIKSKNNLSGDGTGTGLWDDDKQDSGTSVVKNASNDNNGVEKEKGKADKTEGKEGTEKGKTDKTEGKEGTEKGKADKSDGEEKGNEEEHEEDKMCRICWEKEIDTEDNPLIHPCLCSGSIKWVHRQCLLKWIKMSNHDTCQECHHKYHTTIQYKKKWHTWIDNNIFGHTVSITILFSGVYGFACFFRWLSLKMLKKRQRIFPHLSSQIWQLPSAFSVRFMLEGLKSTFALMILLLPWLESHQIIDLSQIQTELTSNSISIFPDIYLIFYKSFYMCIRQIINKIIPSELVIDSHYET